MSDYFYRDAWYINDRFSKKIVGLLLNTPPAYLPMIFAKCENYYHWAGILGAGGQSKTDKNACNYNVNNTQTKIRLLKIVRIRKEVD